MVATRVTLSGRAAWSARAAPIGSARTLTGAPAAASPPIPAKNWLRYCATRIGLSSMAVVLSYWGAPGAPQTPLALGPPRDTLGGPRSSSPVAGLRAPPKPLLRWPAPGHPGRASILLAGRWAPDAPQTPLARRVPGQPGRSSIPRGGDGAPGAPPAAPRPSWARSG